MIGNKRLKRSACCLGLDIGDRVYSQCKKSLSNKNGAYRFVNIFLICEDENIYVLIVLSTNISTKVSRFLVS